MCFPLSVLPWLHNTIYYSSIDKGLSLGYRYINSSAGGFNSSLAFEFHFIYAGGKVVDQNLVQN